MVGSPCFHFKTPDSFSISFLLLRTVTWCFLLIRTYKREASGWHILFMKGVTRYANRVPCALVKNWMFQDLGVCDGIVIKYLYFRILSIILFFLFRKAIRRLDSASVHKNNKKKHYVLRNQELVPISRPGIRTTDNVYEQLLYGMFYGRLQRKLANKLDGKFPLLPKKLSSYIQLR
jgi:hypothetical protein